MLRNINTASWGLSKGFLYSTYILFYFINNSQLTRRFVKGKGLI